MNLIETLLPLASKQVDKTDPNEIIATLEIINRWCVATIEMDEVEAEAALEQVPTALANVARAIYRRANSAITTD